jgi:diguanylate cyclase (GGDEF)-like protein
MDSTTGAARNESWLVPDHTNRARMLDMDRRLQPMRRAAMGVLAVALVITGPWVGYWTLVPLLFAAGLFALADRHIEQRTKPEYGIFAAWTGSQVVIAISFLLAHVNNFPTLAWFAIPVVTLSARFSSRGIVLGVAITLGLMFGVALSADASAVADNPPLLVMPAAAVIAVAILSSALMRSDVEHRSKAALDSLTGMLNRKALQHRVEELRQQSEIAEAPIGLIVIDIDHFKAVNDSVGHAVGDAVLKDVAYIIRKDLRAFELAYRLGGEEFVILLPGSDAMHCMTLAGRLRDAVAATRFAHDVTVTISCGVSVSPAGFPLDYESLFENADAAMYDAKRHGRNRVRGVGADCPEDIDAGTPGNGAEADLERIGV